MKRTTLFALLIATTLVLIPTSKSQVMGMHPRPYDDMSASAVLEVVVDILFVP